MHIASICKNHPFGILYLLLDFTVQILIVLVLFFFFFLDSIIRLIKVQESCEVLVCVNVLNAFKLVSVTINYAVDRDCILLQS